MFRGCSLTNDGRDIRTVHWFVVQGEPGFERKQFRQGIRHFNEVEALLFLYALLSSLGLITSSVVTSLISAGTCVVMCFIAWRLSNWSLRRKGLGHKAVTAIQNRGSE